LYTGPNPEADCLRNKDHRTITVTGTVIDQITGQPIPGILVASNFSVGTTDFTDEYGDYSIQLRAPPETFKLKYEDVDGQTSGLYKGQEKDVNLQAYADQCDFVYNADVELTLANE
jgi:hypothetical protein